MASTRCMCRESGSCSNRPRPRPRASGWTRRRYSLTMVEQPAEPSYGHRCASVLDDRPQQDLIRLQTAAPGRPSKRVNGEGGRKAVPADEDCFGALAEV